MAREEVAKSAPLRRVAATSLDDLYLARRKERETFRRIDPPNILKSRVLIPPERAGGSLRGGRSAPLSSNASKSAVLGYDRAPKSRSQAPEPSPVRDKETCKERPRSNQSKGGGSRRFIPWCR